MNKGAIEPSRSFGSVADQIAWEDQSYYIKSLAKDFGDNEIQLELESLLDDRDTIIEGLEERLSSVINENDILDSKIEQIRSITRDAA